MNPQNQLYRLAETIDRLDKKFEYNEEDGSVFEKIDELYLSKEIILKKMEDLENKMSLIIKLLTK